MQTSIETNKCETKEAYENCIEKLKASMFLKSKQYLKSVFPKMFVRLDNDELKFSYMST